MDKDSAPISDPSVTSRAAPPVGCSLMTAVFFDCVPHSLPNMVTTGNHPSLTLKSVSVLSPILIIVLQQSLENYPKYVLTTKVLKLVILYQKVWFLLGIPGVLLLTFPVRKYICATIY